MSLEGLPYRPCVGLALFNAKGEVFLGERIDTPGAWQMPQGGIDEAEDLERAAFRELSEEIGTQKAKILEILPDTLKYDLPPPLQQKLWDGKYRGQAQHWIALSFTGVDADIVLNAHTPAEFQAWRWARKEHVLDLIVPFKRDVYRIVLDRFARYFTC